MKRYMSVLALCAVLPMIFFTSRSAAEAQEGSKSGWVCPPCGHDHDDRVYDDPGNCPICQMKLITTEETDRRAQQARRERKRVAILVFDGVQIIDFTGPYEVFGQARFDVFTVSRDGRPLTTAMGLRIDPAHAFADAPEADILLVPGGGIQSATSSSETLEWVRRQSERAEYTLSVCNGAFVLAEAGLLDGLTATTFYGLLDSFESSHPEVDVVRDQRYTDNGRILTSAGLSSGIDASLYLVSKVLGMGRAQQIALHMEYDWNPGSDFARAALADRYLPDLDPPAGAGLQLLETRGDRDSWLVRYRVGGDLSTEDLLADVERQLAALGWTPLDGAAASGRSRREWSFENAAGRWTGACEVGGDQSRVASLSIRRED